MKCCPKCKNLNVVDDSIIIGNNIKKFQWCRNCGWSSDEEAVKYLGR